MVWCMIKRHGPVIPIPTEPMYSAFDDHLITHMPGLRRQGVCCIQGPRLRKLPDRIRSEQREKYRGQENLFCTD